MRTASFRTAFSGCALALLLVGGVLAGAGGASAARPRSETGSSSRAPRSERYRPVAGFKGTTSKRTAIFSVPTGSRWLLRWGFDCSGVDRPAFVASGFAGSAHDEAISVQRDGRDAASGTLKSQQTGTFHYRVSADCAWHLTVYSEPVPPSTDLFDEPALRAYLSKRTGSITVAVYDADNGQTELYRPGIAEQTASIVKVDILATLLWQEQGRHSPLDEDDLQLATGMIEDSNNDDASSLWDEVGGGSGVSRFDRVAGLTETAPNTEGYWGETTTTALDQIRLLEHLAFANPLLDSASRSYELGLMEHVVGYEDWGVSTGPTAATVALKNGWLPLAIDDWQINSVGYVDGNGRDYLIAVLTTGDPTESYGIGTIDAISSSIWGELTPPRS